MHTFTFHATGEEKTKSSDFMSVCRDDFLRFSQEIGRPDLYCCIEDYYYCIKLPFAVLSQKADVKKN